MVIKEGDVVTLKSGGPKLTVGDINLMGNRATVYCADADGCIWESSIHLEALIKVVD